MEASQHPSEINETGVDLAKRGTSPWLRPAISRLSAGSAEDGNNNRADGGQPS
jgi:hypothetical protein